MKTLLMIALLLALAPLASAEPPAFSTPVLLTSCGQSVDALSMKILLQRDSISFEYLPQATVADLEGVGSIVLVLGGSTKGLGAAKISAEDELNRVTALLGAAKEKAIPVLSVHLGGAARRGALSDPFNILGAEHADHLIVVKGGDEDQLFAKLAEERKIPLHSADNVLGLDPVIKQLFKPE